MASLSEGDRSRVGLRLVLCSVLSSIAPLYFN